MRKLVFSLFSLSMAFPFVSHADPGDVVCLGGHCPELDVAIRASLAEAGLFDIDSYTLVGDQRGFVGGIKVGSKDVKGLTLVAELTGTRVETLRGVETAFLTIPFSYPEALDLAAYGGDGIGLLLPAVQSSGGGGGGPKCYTVCETQPSGEYCWTVCK